MIFFLGVLFMVPAEAQQGITDTEILIGQWSPQTGPAAITGATARGTACYFDMINEEGGIHGRKIKYFLRDDAYQPPKTKALVKELVENEKLFAFVGGVGTANGMAVRDYLEEHKIPWIGPVSGSTYWAYPPAEYRFGVFPLFSDETSILADYAVKELKKKKIAFFYQNDDYGKAGLVGAEIALEKLGMELVAKVPYEVADTDLSSHCLELKKADPDCVLMTVLPKHGAIMLGTAAKLGFRPLWMSTSTLGDYPLMFKITKGLVSNMIVTSFVELPDSDHPLMVKYREAHAKYAPEDRWGVLFCAGFLFAEPMVEALKRAGRDLTLEGFVAAMESLKDFQGIGPKLTFGPDQRQGSRSVYLIRVKEDGTAEKLTDWVTSDIDVQEVIARLKK